MESITYQHQTYKKRYPGELLLALRRNPLEMLERLAATGGDLVMGHIGPVRIFLVNHPDLVRQLLIDQQDAFLKGRGIQLTKPLLGEGLLTSEGAVHKRHRKLVLPAFHHAALAQYAEVMVRETASMLHNWHAGHTLDVQTEMADLALRIAAGTLLGSSLQDEAAQQVRVALANGLRVFERATNPFFEWMMKLPLPSTRTMENSLRVLNETVHALIMNRRARPRPGAQDLLAMLLAAQDEEDGTRLSDREVRDEVMTLFMAGHETTAVALSWTIGLLVRHPDVMEKLQTELQAVLGDRLPAFSDVRKLVYTRQVFSETLRIRPPAWILARTPAYPIRLDDQRMVPGDRVLVSPWLLHHQSKFWRHPDVFDPARFQSDPKTGRPKFAYLPFSVGQRGCIGEQFAWMEGILVLATIFQRIKLQPTQVPLPLPRPGITLRPADPMWIRIQEAA